jgi:hypothetical protein
LRRAHRPAPRCLMVGTAQARLCPTYGLTHLRDLAASSARVLQLGCCLLESEGTGNAGRSMRPQSRVVVKNTRGSHHGHTENTRHSPRNGFNGFLRALPGDRACLPPSPTDRSANLTPASGRQDHTALPSMACHTSTRSHAPDTPRPPHPAPDVRDVRETPLCVGRDETGDAADLRTKKSGKFFREGLDTIWVWLPVGLFGSVIPGQTAGLSPESITPVIALWY